LPLQDFAGIAQGCPNIVFSSPAVVITHNMQAVALWSLAREAAGIATIILGWGHLLLLAL